VKEFYTLHGTYDVCKNQPLDPVLSQINVAHFLALCFLKIHVIILPIYLFPSGCLSKKVYKLQNLPKAIIIAAVRAETPISEGMQRERAQTCGIQ
jgi:hypothetical protein